VADSVRAGVRYFAAAFGAGFLLGVVRVLVLVPRLGERTSELIEMPFMGAVIYLAARWTVRRMRAPTPARRAGAGAIALGLLLTAELCMVVFVRHLTVREYLAGRDPVSGTAFAVMLALFAAMPVMIGIEATRHPS